MHGRLIAALRGVVVVTALALPAPAVAAADTINVTTQQDTRVCDATSCSVRGALEIAGDGDTIRIPAGTYQLTLGQLSVTTSVTIAGAGADRTTIAGDREQGVRTLQVGGDVSEQPTVAIEHLTLTRGGSSCGPGGNVLNDGTLRLRHVAITDGVAASGGGVANFGTVAIDHSLISGNVAVGCEVAGSGGGVLSYGAGDDALVVGDSTVTANAADVGGGIAVYDVSQSAPPPLGTRLERVTLARNSVFSDASGGLYVDARARAQVSGSIVASNQAQEVDAGERRAAAAIVIANCGATRPSDAGGNLSDTGDCSFATAPADPLLSAELVGGLGETLLLTIAGTSPAIDLAGACTGSDQRDLARPQGAACDAGAYERAAPAIVTGPAGTTGAATATFAFSSPDPDATFECRLDGPAGGGSFAPCASPKGYAALAPGDYVFIVRAAGTSAQSSRAFSVAAPQPVPLPAPPPATPAQVAPTPTPTPTPTYRRNVVVKPTQGTVKVRVPGTRRYVDLDTLDSLPLGSSIDVRKGRVRLYAARDATGRTQAASFFGGVFRVVQRGRVIELQLRGPKPRCASGSATATAANHKPKKKKAKRRTRRLWGSGKGAFRTTGKYSAATVRGTKWLVEDSCRSTTTRVVRGKVAVRDFKRKRTIILRAGDRYVARRVS